MQTRTVSMTFSKSFQHRRVEIIQEEKLRAQWIMNEYCGLIILECQKLIKTMKIWWGTIILNSSPYIFICYNYYNVISIEAVMPGCPFFLVMGVYEHHIKTIQ